MEKKLFIFDPRGRALSKFCREYIGKKNHSWKGDKVKYRALHVWVARWKGKIRKCEKCGTTIAKKYDWANKSGKYQRELNDWIRLCRSCHLKKDFTDERRIKLRNVALKRKRNNGQFIKNN